MQAGYCAKQLCHWVNSGLNYRQNDQTAPLNLASLHLKVVVYWCPSFYFCGRHAAFWRWIVSARWYLFLHAGRLGNETFLGTYADTEISNVIKGFGKMASSELASKLYNYRNPWTASCERFYKPKSNRQLARDLKQPVKNYSKALYVSLLNSRFKQSVKLSEKFKAAVSKEKKKTRRTTTSGHFIICATKIFESNTVEVQSAW